MSGKANIHPTAIVSDKAEVDSSVKVGAYAVIGEGVKVGANCEVGNFCSIFSNTTIGEGNIFHPYCSIGNRTQDLKYKGEPTYLVIGDGNNFREFVTVNRATDVGKSTEIGNGNNFLTYCHIAHDCVVGDNTIFSNNATLAGHVVVEDFAILGGLCAVHQFCKIGEHSIIGGCAKIVQDLPPYLIADGNPGGIRGINLVGLKRRNFTESSIRQLKNFYKAVFLKKANLSKSIEKYLSNDSGSQYAVCQEITRIIDFIEKSERGVMR